MCYFTLFSPVPLLLPFFSLSLFLSPLLLSDLSLSLAHAVHDHVKRDFIFCLSTANGNTYYLQVSHMTCHGYHVVIT